jgi:hypothetical protein
VYIEPVFSQPDVLAQLPAETAAFQQVDQMWKDLMRRTHAVPNVLESLLAPKLLERLVGASKTLDAVRRSLDIYLEAKRVSFPRFYFLSDDELVEVRTRVYFRLLARAASPIPRASLSSLGALAGAGAVADADGSAATRPSAV